MSVPLTQGAIREILLNPNNLPKKPILQVLGLKKVSASQGSGSNERYRMVLSDGVHAHTCAMLATQLNHMVSGNEIEVNAVIRLDKYICNIIQETRKVLILLEVSVLQKGAGTSRFGEPQQFDEKTAAKGSGGTSIQNSRPSIQQSSAGAKQNRSNFNTGNANRNQPTSNGSRFSSNQAPVSQNQKGPTIFPISSLNPYHNRWTICARVTSKSSIREWSNSRGQGRLFNVDLIDESGEIRATCFTDLVNKFYPLLEQNKVYYISKGSLRPANKKYSSIKNDYELTFNHDTTVELCTEKDDLPTLQFDFCEIANIERVDPEDLVDLIGVCTGIADVSEITTRIGKSVLKRDISLLDRTAVVSCTLWGKDAENFQQYKGSSPIVAIKGAKVSDYGGRSLSLLTSSVMQVNPDNLEEAFSLRGWYDTLGENENIPSISGQRGEGKMTTVYKDICDIATERLGMAEKPDYFKIIGSVSYYKKENSLYKACPREDCNKKVLEDGDHYRCEKCNQTYPNYKYRFLLRINVSDYSGEQWMTCFQDTAEHLLDIKANVMGEYQETDEKALLKVFSKNNFNRRVFNVRAKMDKFNDEARINCTADKVSEIDYRKEARRLVQEIDKLME